MPENEETEETPSLVPSIGATHLALPIDVMNELVTVAATKYTWAELDPLMSKVKKYMLSFRVTEDGVSRVSKTEG
jgi:hypothetical protein